MKQQFNQMIRRRVGPMPTRLMPASIAILAGVVSVLTAIVFFVRLDDHYMGMGTIGRVGNNDTLVFSEIPKQILNNTSLRSHLSIGGADSVRVTVPVQQARIISIDPSEGRLVCIVDPGLIKWKSLDMSQQIKFDLTYLGETVFKRIIRQNSK